MEPYILKYIPMDKPVKRAELVLETGLSDRKIRSMIEEARDAGYLIVNSGAGYYRTSSLDVIERQYHRDHSQALSILKRCKTMRKLLKEAGRNV